MSNRLILLFSTFYLFSCKGPLPDTNLEASKAFVQALRANSEKVDQVEISTFLSEYDAYAQDLSVLIQAEKCHSFGTKLRDKNKYATARLCFREALRLRLKHFSGNRKKKDVIRAYCMIGATYNDQGNFHDALPYLDTASVWLPDAVKPHILVLINLGQSYDGTGDISHALKICKAAKDSIDAHRGDSIHSNWSLKLLQIYTSCARKSKQYSLALILAKEGLMIADSLKDKISFEETLVNVLQDSMLNCKTNTEKDRTSREAATHVQQAIRLYIQEDITENILRASANFGEFYRRIQRFTEAERVLQNAINLIRTRNYKDFAPLHINLGEVYADQNWPNKALLEYQTAINCMLPSKGSLATTLPKDWSNLLYIYGNIAKTHLSMENLKEAIVNYDSLILLTKLLRSNLVTQDGKLSLASQSQKALSSAVNICAELYKAAIAKEERERYKAQAFFMAEQSKGFALLEEMRLQGASVSNPNQKQRLENVLRDVPIDIFQKRLLSRDQALLSYYVQDSILNIFLLKQNDLVWKQKFIAKQTLVDMSNQFRDFLTANVQQDAIRDSFGHQLYLALLAPVKDYLEDSKRLVVVPSNPFLGVPFEAFPVQRPELGAKTLNQIRDSNYLLYHYSVSYAASADIWAIMQNSNPKRGEVATFAPSYSNMDNLLTKMENNIKECYSIKNIVRAEAFFEKDATKSAFIEASKKFNVLHFAGHGYCNLADPNRSFIAFNQPGPQTDKRQLLYLPELYHIDLSQDLIVLSACETSSGQYASGEGNLSIERGLAYAGAKSFVTTFWSIFTKPGVEIMPAFYGYLSKGYPKDEALAEAKRKYALYHSAPPVEWAGLVLNGNTQPIEIAPKQGRAIWIILSSIALLFVFGWVGMRKNQRK